MSKDLIVTPQGASSVFGGKSDNPPKANPIVADDTERTVSSVILVDIISEGPILGLVNGAQSVFLNNEQWMLSSGNFNKQGIHGHFRYGLPEQEPLPYKWIEQTFDVNQKVTSASNSIGLKAQFEALGIAGVSSIDPSRGVLISNAAAGLGYQSVIPAITLGNPGDGNISSIFGAAGVSFGFTEFIGQVILAFEFGWLNGTNLGQTAIPTSAPSAGLRYTTGWEMYISNPGANIIGDGNGTLFQTYVYEPSGGGWQASTYAEIEGGVVRTITNPNAKAVKVVLKVDKLYQQSGNGDVQPAELKFVIQYKTASDNYWTTCRLLNKHWYALPLYYFDVAMPMYYPIRAPTGWNWFSLVGIFGPQYFVGALKVEVALRVKPHSRFDCRLQTKLMDSSSLAGFGPHPGVDIRGPEEGWSDASLLFGGSTDFAVYSPSQSGFNASDQPQVMRFTLYYMNTLNIAIYGLRVIDLLGNGVIGLSWSATPSGPQYTSYGNGVTPTNAGVQTLYAKTQEGIQLDYIVELPQRPALVNSNLFDNVQLRVIRLTTDDIYTDMDAQDALTRMLVPADDAATRSVCWLTFSSLTWAAYVELVENTIQYADTAVMGFEFNSQWTGSSIPSRSYDIYGRIIRVPSNYNAFTHTYTGIWDGTFQLSWSNNPVWIFLDLLTHTRYGLGQWINDSMVDFAALYQVAQYCDAPVKTDGDLAFSPRFTFNTQITSQDQAYNVLAMLSSVFRGMVYWAAGGITITQDAPLDPSRVVTPANVIGGDFQYVGSSLQARHSVVVVQWSDPNNFGKDRQDVWEDPDLIARYGYVTTEMKAWGCTSFSQAMRMARWLLETEKHATEVVTYRAGFDHADARPGEIIAIADPTITGIRFGGRIVSGTASQIILDEVYPFSPTESYTLTIQIPTWGKVSVRNGDFVVRGVGTSFTAMLGGEITFVGGDGAHYVYQVVDNTTLNLRTDDYFTGTKNYVGPDLTEVDFTTYFNTFTFPETGIGIDSRIIVVERNIVNPGGPTNLINLTSPLPLTPNNNVVFIITGQTVAPRLFTIVGNKEIDPHTYEISALAYDPTKFDRVESF